MAEALCPSCKNWRRAEAERFCGLCGASMMDVAFVVATGYRYADRKEPQGGQADDPLIFELRSPKPSDLEQAQIRVALELDQTEDVLERLLPDQLETYGENQVLLFKAETLPGDRPVSGRLVQKTEDGRRIATLARFGLRLPQPRLSVEPRQFELTEDDLQRARLRLRLICDDGLIAPVERIVIGEEADGLVAAAPICDGPAVIEPGRDLTVELELSAAFRSRLRDQPAGLRLTFSVGLIGRTSLDVVAPVLFRLDRPPRPVLVVPSEVEAMAGADLCLPLAIENRGAAPVELATIVLQEKATAPDGDGTALATRDLGGRRLDGGQRYEFMLDVRAEDGAARLLEAPGNHLLWLEQRFATSEVPPLGQELPVTVRPEREFDEFVSIDFGTTESAASVFMNGRNQSPECLQLGDEGFFIPTVVAYRGTRQGSLDCKVGASARTLARTQGGLDLKYFDSIKWRLAEPDPLELPNGDMVDWTRIAADYLREMKRRIEGHPRIAARVTRAYVTRPARFDGRAIGALLAAYRQAGIEPQLLPCPDGRSTTISESWPPSILGLARPNLDGLRRAAIEHPESMLGANPTGKRHRLLTVDIGGGSADFSLFDIDYQNFANVEIEELMFDGDHAVAGNAVGEWIYQFVVRPNLMEAIAKEGLNADDVPVHFAWQPLPEKGVSRVQERNGLALSLLVFEIQRNTGPFRDLFTAMQRALSAPDAPDALSPLRPTERTGEWDVDLRNHLFADHEGHDRRHKWQAMEPFWRQVPYVPQPLSLETAKGALVTIAWPAQGIHIDFAAAMESFIDRFQRPILTQLAPFATVSDERGANATPMQILITGRGSLFPLLNYMLMAAFSRLFPNGGATRTVQATMSKPITSMGACYIADFVLKDPDIRFVAKLTSQLAVLGPSDRIDPQKRMALPLSNGELRPDGKLHFAKKKELPGKSLREIEFVMIAEGETTVGDKRHHALFPVRETVEIPPKVETYAVVRMLDEELLEIGLGWAPRPVGEGAGEEAFERIEWLDTRKLPRA